MGQRDKCVTDSICLDACSIIKIRKTQKVHSVYLDVLFSVGETDSIYLAFVLCNI